MNSRPRFSCRTSISRTITTRVTARYSCLPRLKCAIEWLKSWAPRLHPVQLTKYARRSKTLYCRAGSYYIEYGYDDGYRYMDSKWLQPSSRRI